MKYCLLLLTLISPLVWASPSAQDILAASDAVRNPGRPFSQTTTLIEYRDGHQVDGNTLTIYSRAASSGGSFNTLVRFEAPARDAGKLLLKNGNDLWFFDPASKASVRISPQQRLLGQAANGDVMTVNLARDYRASLAGSEDMMDGERQTRHCWHLTLTATAADVTYHAIDMWIEQGSNRPIKARFYAESGHLLKTAYYRHYQQVLGQDRPVETVIIDGLDPQWITVMRSSQQAWRDFPASWLQRDYLPRFHPE